jgi:hypothetical protein
MCCGAGAAFVMGWGVILVIYHKVIWLPFSQPSRFNEPRLVRVARSRSGAPHLHSSIPTRPKHSDTPVFRRSLPSPYSSAMLFAFPSLALRTRYQREQASGTLTGPEDPARDKRATRLLGIVLTQLLAPGQLLRLLPGDLPCVNDYFSKVVCDLHCVHHLASTSYDYID